MVVEGFSRGSVACSEPATRLCSRTCKDQGLHVVGSAQWMGVEVMEGGRGWRIVLVALREGGGPIHRHTLCKHSMVLGVPQFTFEP